jgi:hypothetical protein
MKLMEFIRDCDSGAEPFNCKSIKKSSYEEVDVTVLQWFNQKKAEGTPHSGPICAQIATFFMKLLDWKVSSVSPLDG